MNFKELQDIIKNNLDFLSQIGDFNSNIGAQGIDNEDGYFVSKGWDSINEFLMERFYEIEIEKVSRLIKNAEKSRDV